MNIVLNSLIAATLLVVNQPPAKAQNFPTRPVTFVVPWPAGADTVLRVLATATEKHLGQPIVIENKAGASGTLGPAQMAATAKSDGYTVSQLSLPVFRAPFLRKTAYDPSKDFTYIIGIAGYTYGVVVRSDAPWKSFQDFVADAKARPGKINYATNGADTTQYIAMEQITKQLGVKLLHIPFKGGAELMNALLAGHIDAIAGPGGWAPYVNAGQFRLLVTWGANRSKNWPVVPNLKDVGINMIVISPYGIAGPRGMDPMVVKLLHDAFKKGLEDPSHISALEKFDQEVFYLNSEDYHKFAIKQIAEEKRMVEELALKQE